MRGHDVGSAYEDYARIRQAGWSALHPGTPHHCMDVLGWLGAGMTEEEILAEHPDLKKEDFPAVYQYAAAAGRNGKFG